MLHRVGLGQGHACLGIPSQAAPVQVGRGDDRGVMVEDRHLRMQVDQRRLLQAGAALVPGMFRLARCHDEGALAKRLRDDVNAFGLKILAIAGIALLGVVIGHILGRAGQDKQQAQVGGVPRRAGQGAGHGQAAEELRFQVDQAAGLAGAGDMGVLQPLLDRLGRQAEAPGIPVPGRDRAQQVAHFGWLLPRIGDRQQRVEMRLRLARRWPLDQQLRVMPGVAARTVVIGRVIAALIQVDAADEEPFPVEHGQFLMVRGRDQRRDRPDLRAQMRMLARQMRFQPRHMGQLILGLAGLQPVQPPGLVAQLGRDLGPEGQAHPETHPRRVHGRDDRQQIGPPRSLARRHQAGRRAPGLAVHRGPHDGVEIGQDQAEGHAARQRVADQVGPGPAHFAAPPTQPGADVEHPEPGRDFGPRLKKQRLQRRVGLGRGQVDLRGVPCLAIRPGHVSDPPGRT